MKAAFAIVLMLLGMCAAHAAGPSSHRAIWIWEKPSYRMLENAQYAEEMAAFMQGKQIDTLYLYADAYDGRNLIQQRPELYAALIRRFHQRGFRVHALLGSAYLETERYVLRKHRGKARAMFARIYDYNVAAAESDRFDGINFDIEPHLLDAWDHDRDALLLGFLDMGRMAMALKRKSGMQLEVGPAMPFWWDNIVLKWNGARRPVSEHAIDLFDYVALMDYRNHADGSDGIIEHARAEMEFSQRMGKRVVIGVEVTPNDLAKVTFDGLDEAVFERELAATAQAYAGNPAFDGFVIHHLIGYREWLRKQSDDK